MSHLLVLYVRNLALGWKSTSPQIALVEWLMDLIVFQLGSVHLICMDNQGLLVNAIFMQQP